MKSTRNQKLISHGKNGFAEVSKNLAMHDEQCCETRF